MEVFMSEEVFARMTFDTIFKIVFTREKNRKSLLFLLNTCLRKVLKKPITGVRNVQTAEPGESGDNRVAVFDMQCEDADGARFIVEMQVGEQEHFIKRTHFYHCRAVSNLAKKGRMEIDGKKTDYDYDIPVVYTLSFLDFEVDFGKGCDEIVQYLSIRNDMHPEVRYDVMRMVYVLLPRFAKDEWADCEDAFEQLVFAFRRSHALKEKPSGFMDEALDEIFESAKISNLKPEELMDYEIEKKRRSDYAATLEWADKKGETRGIKKLLALWRQGYSIDEAEKMLGLAK
jgi:predicted transposase/invertase (TIGR01784 family)